MKRELWKIIAITSSIFLILFCNIGCVFESAMRPLTLEMSPALYGTVSGAGNYMVGSSVTITATPFSGYRFIEWDDDNTETIRTITIPPGGANYVAYFEKVLPLTYVAGGNFQMGLPSGYVGYLNELPMHSVTVDSFWIGTYEITQDIYEEVMNQNRSSHLGEYYPVEGVTWFDAVRFCNALSQRDGLEMVYTINGTNVSCDWSKRGYRLPTEAEWEYAALGGNSSEGYEYSGSNDASEVAKFSGNTTYFVGAKKANELGLFDMSGNVYEWCWDWFDSTYYTSSPVNNPSGPSSGSLRVIRGGSFYGNVSEARSKHRYNAPPEDRYNNVGLRVVLPVL